MNNYVNSVPTFYDEMHNIIFYHLQIDVDISSEVVKQATCFSVVGFC